MMNKKGSIVDLFLFMILGFVVVVICGMFVYVGNTMEDELRDNADKFNTTSQSGDELITETFGAVNRSYNALPWITFAFIMAYVLGILVSGYFITVKSPVYFVPYIIIVIVAVIVSAPISNVYEEIIHNPTLESTFSLFTASNYIFANLPIWVAVVGVFSGIIMFVMYHKRPIGDY